MKIALNIFTNCHASAPSTKMVRDTYQSFVDAFGPTRPIVWCDPNPRPGNFPKYKTNLLQNFSVVNQTRGFSDGYIQSIKNSDADYLFQLEGDWTFNPGMIKHDLQTLIKAMSDHGIYHLRFNKRKNEIAGWDVDLKPVKYSGIDFCITPILSNNPHIIDRKKYLEFIAQKKIIVLPGSKGIEEIISKCPETWGAIYGGIGYPQAVKHIDGRRSK